MYKVVVILFFINLMGLEAQDTSFIECLFDARLKLSELEKEVECFVSKKDSCQDSIYALQEKSTIFFPSSACIIMRVRNKIVSYAYLQEPLNGCPQRMYFFQHETNDYIFYSLVSATARGTFVMHNSGGVLVYKKDSKQLYWVDFGRLTPVSIPPEQDKGNLIQSICLLDSNLIVTDVFRFADGKFIGLNTIKFEDGKYLDVFSLVNDRYLDLKYDMKVFPNLKAIAKEHEAKPPIWIGKIVLEKKPYCFLY